MIVKGWSAAPAGRKAGSASVTFSASQTTEWARKGGTWQRQNGHGARGQEFKASSLLVLFAAVWTSFYVAGQITNPILALARGTEALAGGDLTYRVPGSGGDETLPGWSASEPVP